MHLPICTNIHGHTDPPIWTHMLFWKWNRRTLNMHCLQEVCVFMFMCAWGKTTNLCFSSNHLKIQSRFLNGLLATVQFGICCFGSPFFYSFLQLIIKCTNRIVQFYWGWCHTVWNIKFLELLLVTCNWFCAVCCFMPRGSAIFCIDSIGRILAGGRITHWTH